MYGMVNRAMRDLVIQAHGEGQWEAICEGAGVEERDFIGLQQYPDELTYNLVGSASKTLSVPAEELLKQFGRFWIPFAKERYQAVFQVAGGSFVEFLRQLDAMHERMRTTFPNFQPPSFRLREKDPSHFLLDYVSFREGLEPFVVGLLEGLAELYEISLSIELADKSDSASTFAIAIEE
jgi:hypothetical protein